MKGFKEEGALTWKLWHDNKSEHGVRNLTHVSAMDLDLNQVLGPGPGSVWVL
jgi:hypothetical protein